MNKKVFILHHFYRYIVFAEDAEDAVIKFNGVVKEMLETRVGSNNEKILKTFLERKITISEEGTKVENFLMVKTNKDIYRYEIQEIEDTGKPVYIRI